MSGIVFFILVTVIVILALVAIGRWTGGSSRSGQHICDACGAPHPPMAQFCRRCGKKL